jgi:hypothetical protein
MNKYNTIGYPILHFIPNPDYKKTVDEMDALLSDLNPMISDLQQFTHDYPDKNVVEKVHNMGKLINNNISIVNHYIKQNSLLYVASSEKILQYIDDKPKIVVYEFLFSIGKYYDDHMLNYETYQPLEDDDIPNMGIGLMLIYADEEHEYVKEIIDTVLKKSEDVNHYNDIDLDNVDNYEDIIERNPKIFEEMDIFRINSGSFYYSNINFDGSFLKIHPSEVEFVECSNKCRKQGKITCRLCYGDFSDASNLQCILERKLHYSNICTESILHIEKKIINENPTMEEINKIINKIK